MHLNHYGSSVKAHRPEADPAMVTRIIASKDFPTATLALPHPRT
jgi:hypothetical protein